MSDGKIWNTKTLWNNRCSYKKHTNKPTKTFKKLVE